MAMPESSKLQIRGRSYRLRPFNELIGHLRQLTENLERGALDPLQLLSALRENVVIVAPSARWKITKWTNHEVMTAAVITHAHVVTMVGVYAELFNRNATAMIDLKDSIAAFVAISEETEHVPQ
jgi:hypothetical protein